MYDNRIKTIIVFSFSIILCLVTGYTAGILQAEAITQWYPLLNKPPLTPPNIVFPIAWTILYVLMGISFALVILSKIKSKRAVIVMFVVQLILNWLWSLLFFRMQNPLLGYIDIVVLDGIVLWYTLVTFKQLRTSSILFMPYLAWLLFATYLNLYIIIYN